MEVDFEGSTFKDFESILKEFLEHFKGPVPPDSTCIVYDIEKRNFDLPMEVKFDLQIWPPEVEFFIKTPFDTNVVSLGRPEKASLKE